MKIEALIFERKQRLWTPNWNRGSKHWTKTNNYERQATKDDFECRKRGCMVALNVKLNDDQRLWTPNWEETLALNTKAKMRGRIWTLYLRMDGGSECQNARKRWGGNMPQCGMNAANLNPLERPEKESMNLKITMHWKVMAIRDIKTRTSCYTESSSRRKS